MKTTVIKIEGIDSILAPAGVEKHMCTLPGIHKVETNFLTGTATVVHDESVSIEAIKRCVAECGYTCTGECLPEHLTRRGNPPAAIAGTMEHSAHAGNITPARHKETAHQVHDMSAHAGHVMPAARPSPPTDIHAGHKLVAEEGVSGEGEMASMAHEIGHGAGMSMEGMLQDVRNRFLVSFVLAIPVFLYSPLFTDTFGIQLPLPFGLSNEVLSFLLATPAVFYGGRVFYIGAWRGLKNKILNMSVLVSLSVMAGYLFSVAATLKYH